MSHEIINLTLPITIQEIENVLEDYPEHPYQVAFAIHELRQKLIAHVLSHIPNRYTVEGTQLPPRNRQSLDSSLEQRVRLETLIRGGILHILRENADWVGRHIPQNENSGNETSRSSVEC